MAAGGARLQTQALAEAVAVRGFQVRAVMPLVPPLVLQAQTMERLAVLAQIQPTAHLFKAAAGAAGAGAEAVIRRFLAFPRHLEQAVEVAVAGKTHLTTIALEARAAHRVTLQEVQRVPQAARSTVRLALPASAHAPALVAAVEPQMARLQRLATVATAARLAAVAVEVALASTLSQTAEMAAPVPVAKSGFLSSPTCPTQAQGVLPDAA